MKRSGRICGIAGAALALLTIPVLAACAQGGNGGGEGGKKVNIAVLEYTNSGDIVQAYVRGAKSVVTGDGGSVTLFNANFDPQAQISQCQDAVTSGRFDAIILVPVDPATGVPCVKAAQAANIPVATLETAVGKDAFSLKPQVKGVVAVATTPIEEVVDVFAQLVTEACGDARPCEVIDEIASPSDPYTTQLADGVEAKVKADDISIVQRISTGYDPAQVASQLPDALSAHPNATVFLAASDSSAIAAVAPLKTAGLTDKVKIIGSGGSSEGAAAVADGSVFATTGNWPKQYGALLAEALVQAVNGEKVKNVSINFWKVDTPVKITKDNVSTFTPEWGAGTN